jgi:hypothetical protein
MFWPLNLRLKADAVDEASVRLRPDGSFGTRRTVMKLAVLGGVAVICAATAIVAAQQAAPTEQTQTVIGCLRGEGSAQSPWVLAGVVIPPPPAPGAGRGGGGGGRGGGRGAGAPGAGREGGGPPPAAAPAPPTPPPPPIDLRITGLDLTPWRGYRAQVEGTMGPAGGARTFAALSARSVYNYGCDSK